jgi:hypothetical protein
MPHLPMPPTQNEIYAKNTKDQYEALGRFIEAFEMMVNEVREVSIEIVSRDGKHYELVQVPFHHGALTAKPLYEIMRALIAEVIHDSIDYHKSKEAGVIDNDPPLAVSSTGAPLNFTIADRDVFFGVLKFIADEYNDLVTKRNNLLHATWFIGYVSTDDPNASEFYVRKYTTAKGGLTALPLPKNAAELKNLAERCDAVRTWIAWLQSCLKGEDSILDRFESSGGKWFFVSHAGQKTTLPDTPLAASS